MYGASVGQKLTWAGNGPCESRAVNGYEKITVHYGLESPWAAKGPKDTKGLIWAERRHGPYMGRK